MQGIKSTALFLTGIILATVIDGCHKPAPKPPVAATRDITTSGDGSPIIVTKHEGEGSTTIIQHSTGSSSSNIITGGRGSVNTANNSGVIISHNTFDDDCDANGNCRGEVTHGHYDSRGNHIHDLAKGYIYSAPGIFVDCNHNVFITGSNLSVIQTEDDIIINGKAIVPNGTCK